MIRLNHTATLQNFVLTCTELGVLTNPFYLFVFTNCITNEVQKIVLENKSSRRLRYDRFQINGDFFNSPGWHYYTVYEQDSFNNTDIALANGIVEEGRLFIESIHGVSFTENNHNENFKEYDGQ